MRPVRDARRLRDAGGVERQQRHVRQARGRLRDPHLGAPRGDLAVVADRALERQQLRRPFRVPAVLVLAHPLHAHRLARPPSTTAPRRRRRRRGRSCRSSPSRRDRRRARRPSAARALARSSRGSGAWPATPTRSSPCRRERRRRRTTVPSMRATASASRIPRRLSSRRRAPAARRLFFTSVSSASNGPARIQSRTAAVPSSGADSDQRAFSIRAARDGVPFVRRRRRRGNR